MINNVDELLELVDTYDKWTKRILVALVAIGLAYGSFKYGYNKGMDRAFAYVQKNLADMCAEDEKSSSSYNNPNENQPGKMRSPEA